jgi:hypothetical protein
MGIDPPPMNWSTLMYALRQTGGPNEASPIAAKVEAQGAMPEDKPSASTAVQRAHL